MSKPDQPENSPEKKINPLSINPDAAQDFLKKKKTKPDASNLTEGILKGDRVLLKPSYHTYRKRKSQNIKISLNK